MSAIPSVFRNNFESVKAQKKFFVNPIFGSGYENNHPNRLSVLRLTGTLDIEFDGRDSALVTGLNTFKTTDAWDFSDLPVWTRRFNEELPTIFGISQTPTASGHGLETGEFYVSQEIFRFWRFGLYFGGGYASAVVGQSTTIFYERDTVDDPFIEMSTETNDLTATWTPFIGDRFDPTLYKGGDPTSGGRGPDNDENSVRFATWPDIYGGTILYGVEVYRLPWDINWANESSKFTDAVTDYIAAKNIDTDGGWTGSTTMTLEFS